MTRLMAVHALFAVLLATGLSCSADLEPCPRVEGEFYTTYTPLANTVSAPLGGVCNIGPYILPVGDAPNETITTTHLDKVIQNDVRKKGCQIAMDVTVREPNTGNTRTFIRGDVAVVNSTHLAGTVAGTVFDQSGQAACTAHFQAEMIHRDVMLQAQQAQQANQFGNAAAGMGGTLQQPVAMPPPLPAPAAPQP